MKKFTFGRMWAITLAMLLTLTSVSCDFGNLTTPKKVSVSTEAEYKVNVGDLASLIPSDSFDFESKFSEMLAGIGAGYQWEKSESDAPLTYLLRLSMDSIDLDIGAQIGDLDIDQKLKELTDGSKTEIPEVEIPTAVPFNGFSISPVEIPDMTSRITDSVDLGNALTIPTVECNQTLASQTVKVQKDSDSSINYSKLTIKSGGLLIKATRTDGNELGSGYSLTMTVTLKDSSSAVISTASKLLTEGGNFEVSLAGKSLPQEFDIEIGGTVTGSHSTPEEAVLDSSHIHSYKVEVGFTDDFKLKKIEGLNADASSLGASLPTISDISIPLDSMIGVFESASLGDDSAITLRAAKKKLVSEPEKDFFESGLNITPTITLSGAGLTDVAFKNDDDTTGYIFKQTCDLGGKSIVLTEDDSSIVANGSIDFSLSNATINFDDGSSATTIDIELKPNINTIKEAVIDLKNNSMFSGLNLSPELGELDENMVKYVKGISFGTLYGSTYCHTDKNNNPDPTNPSEGFGIAYKILNTLPAGNDIPISIHSTLFDINIQGALESGGSDYVSSKLVDWPTITISPENRQMDLSFALGGSDGKMAIKNLELNTTYKIGLKVDDFLFDWDTVTVDLSGIDGLSGEQDMESFNLASMMENLPFDKSQFANLSVTDDTVKAFVYMQNSAENSTEDNAFTNLLNKVSLRGSISFDGTQVIDNQTVEFVEPVQWPEEGVTKITDESEVVGYLTKEKSSLQLDTFDDFVNKMFKDVAASSESSGESEVTEESGENSETTSSSKLAYNFAIGGVDSGGTTLHASELKNMTGGVKIGIDVAVVLSFEMNLAAGGIKMTLSDLIDSSGSSEEESSEPSDLLNRTEATEFSDKFSYTDSNGQTHYYTDAIGSVKLNCKLRNFILSDIPLSLIVRDRGCDGDTNYTQINKSVDLSGNDITISFTDDEFDDLLKHFFNPEISILLGKETEDSTLKIPSSALKALSSSASEAEKFSFMASLSVKGSGAPATIDLTSFTNAGGSN